MYELIRVSVCIWQVLDTFLVLNIKEVDLSGNAVKLQKMKRKEKMLKLSRRERKVSFHHLLYKLIYYYCYLNSLEGNIYR